MAAFSTWTILVVDISDSAFSCLTCGHSSLGNGLALEANLRYSRQHEDLVEDEGWVLLLRLSHMHRFLLGWTVFMLIHTHAHIDGCPENCRESKPLKQSMIIQT